jgi:hypothetical protein
MSRESTRKLTRRVRLGCVAALASAIAALVLIPSASAFTTDKYWGPDIITPNTSVYEPFAGDWKRNKIWWNAPATHIVELWFDVTGQQWYWQKSKVDTPSPFAITAPSLIHSRAVCRAQANGAQNATCQVFDWNA